MQAKQLQFLVFLTFFFSGSVFGEETNKSNTLKNISSKNTTKIVAPIYHPSVKNIENPDKKFRRKERGGGGLANNVGRVFCYTPKIYRF